MKRHRPRKIASAHRRGEHLGFNLKFARLGCESCLADVEQHMTEWKETMDALLSR